MPTTYSRFSILTEYLLRRRFFRMLSRCLRKSNTKKKGLKLSRSFKKSFAKSSPRARFRTISRVFNTRVLSHTTLIIIYSIFKRFFRSLRSPFVSVRHFF